MPKRKGETLTNLFSSLCAKFDAHTRKTERVCIQERERVVNIFILIFNIADSWALMRRSGHIVVHAMLQQVEEYKVRYFCVSFECFTLPGGKCPKRMEFCGWINHKYSVSIIIFIYFYYTRHRTVFKEVFMGLSFTDTWFHF